MILQQLVEYYDRSDEVAPAGWERKRIPFIIEIADDGQFLQLTAMKFGPKATDVPAQLIPKAEIRSGTRAYEKPNLLWDHIGFVLGHPKTTESRDQETAKKQLTYFQARIQDRAAKLPGSAPVQAVRLFYERNEHHKVASDPNWSICAAIPGCNVTFRMNGCDDLVLHDPGVRALIDAAGSEDIPTAEQGTCLITGQAGVIATLHDPISGIGPKPAPLAAINDQSLPALASFGKHQGENFPVGKAAAFKYATALNHLLRPDSRQKLRVADSTAVFWAQRADPLEDEFAQIFGNDDDPDHRTELVRKLFDAVRSGRYDGARGDNQFYVLGLAPNAARIAVRFWHAAPLQDIAKRVAAWFDDLDMVRGAHDHAGLAYPSLFRVLTALAVQGKADNIPPRLAGDLMRSILAGIPYPASWLAAVVQRCRAEQQVNHLRAASLRAYLRRARPDPKHPNQREISPMLDVNHPSTAYRLGRLFAALERIQEEASPGLNATIRERYYGAASSTPVTVFTTLMRLKNHHLAKLQNKGRVVNFEKLLADIIGGIADFPAHLNLPDQGRFAIGYYHQRQDFFTPRSAAAAEAANADADTTTTNA